MPIEWTPALAVGVELVDAQHQELFKRVNALLAALGQHSGPEEVTTTVAFVSSYVLEHFGAEERLMEAYPYAGAEAHRGEHAAFLETFGTLAAALDRDGPSGAIAIRLNHFLCGWLRDHVSRTDRELGRHLLALRAGGGIL